MKKLIVTLFCFLLATSSNAASLDDVMSALNKQNFALAVQLATPLANQGSLDAQYLLGIFLLGGQDGVDKNPEKAVSYLNQCVSNSGKPEMSTSENLKGMCFLMLYSAYLDGKGVKKNIKQAGTYLGDSARLGNEKAISLATSLHCADNDPSCAAQIRVNFGTPK